MSWIRIWVHLVFTTKYNEIWLNKEIRNELFNHVREYARNKDIWLDRINGYEDHVHCLISLNCTQSISAIAHLIKGESSHWLNENFFKHGQALWQDDYWAASCCENDLKALRKYIEEQEIHHKRASFEDELIRFNLKKNK